VSDEENCVLSKKCKTKTLSRVQTGNVWLQHTMKHHLITNHVDVVQSGDMVSIMFDHLPTSNSFETFDQMIVDL